MPAKNQDLHGNVPDQSAVALLIIDIINDFEYPGGRELLQNTLPVAKRIAALKRRAKAVGIPVIYANDNFGRWQSDFNKQVRHCLEKNVCGEPVVRLLKPDEEDYFVLKPKHSAFYATPLDILLNYLRVTTLILTGIAGDSCVLFTANDAYMRDFHLCVPSDCTASIRKEDNRYSLKQMRNRLDADTRPSAKLDLEALKKTSKESNPAK
jgi:nicotinamidase-related amidase